LTISSPPASSKGYNPDATTYLNKQGLAIMDEARYSILFDGVTLAGMPDKIVKANLARLFKRELSEIDALFGSDAVILKRGLSAEEATRYIQDLRQAGAIARKSREVPEKPVPPKPAVLALVDEPPKTNQDEAVKATNPWDSPGNFWGASPASSGSSTSTSSANTRQNDARSRPSDLRQDEFFGGSAPPGSQSTRRSPASNGDYCALDYISVEGRLGRIRYLGWGFGGGLALAGGFFCVAVLAALMGKLAIIPGVILGITGIAFSITLTVRRLHDVNLSGWWILLPFILVAWGALTRAQSPTLLGVLGIANLIITLYLCLKGGTFGNNNYGPPPPPNSLGVTILAFIVIILYALAFVLGFNKGKGLNRNIRPDWREPTSEPEANGRYKYEEANAAFTALASPDNSPAKVLSGK
jgi:uncharacterized membrane protein YhaH (DUF805 family)